MKRISHSYFVVMIDYGRNREAVVDPELTRQNVVDRIASGEYDHERIAFIHHIDGMYIEDVTKEIVADARLQARMAAPMISLAERIQSDFDHARDLRKNEVVS